MRIILIGPPGSGKGTQGDMVENAFGFPRISTGDLLRTAVAAKTPLGLKAKADMDRGELVEDNIVLNMIEDRIHDEDCREGYLLDGFPRNIAQAKMLEELDGNRPEVVLDIRVDDKILIQRLSARRICSCGSIYNLMNKKPRSESLCDECAGELIHRDDDRPEVIEERLRVYHTQTEPLVDYYTDKGGYHPVDGARDVDAVFADVKNVLDKVLG